MVIRNKEVVCLFQDKVSELLLRHRSILDTLSKHQDSVSRVNRSISKTVTGCGCISIHAYKQEIPPGVTLEDCRKYMDPHLDGDLVENCRETIQEEIGNNLFYLAALCHLLNIDLENIYHKEYDKLSALGYFHLL